MAKFIIQISDDVQADKFESWVKHRGDITLGDMVTCENYGVDEYEKFYVFVSSAHRMPEQSLLDKIGD